MDENEKSSEEKVPAVLVRESRVLLWGPIFITLNLEKTAPDETNPASSENIKPSQETSLSQAGEGNSITSSTSSSNQDLDDNNKNNKGKVNILSPAPNAAQGQPKQDNTKKVTYIYNLVDHGLNCDCIDVKGELLIRSALPTYRKISQGIEYEQISPNQAKIIITSRVLDNYQEVFQGFTIPKATFRVWILGYKVN